MREKNRNYLEILIVVLLASGLIYAFYNVLNGRIQGQENRENIKKVSNIILKSVNTSERMECKTTVYLELEEEEKQDEAQKTGIVHDFRHQCVQIERKGRVEIFEYGHAIPSIYSKGVSPVYNREDAMMKKVSRDRWYKYSTEKMYGRPWKRGKCDQISYGYLTDETYIRRIEKKGEVKEGEKTYTEYRAKIRNPLRAGNESEDGDNGFRKTLGVYGLDVMTLKKGYPEVYRMLQDIYNRDVEEMNIWVDEKGNMVRIEKDHTFLYYLEIMKENSEKIEEKVGKYGYPNVYCRQDYTYNPGCKTVEMPEKFKEL